MAKIAKIEKSAFLSPTTRQIAFPLASQNVIFDAESNGVLRFSLAITVFEIQGSRHENIDILWAILGHFDRPISPPVVDRYPDMLVSLES